jgi:alkylresorcinol/alkylpyrone synthase
MVRISGTSIESPEHVVDAEECRSTLAALLPARAAMRVSRMIEEARISQRHAVAPLTELAGLRTTEARNREFVRHARRLGAACARKALKAAGVEPADVSALVCVSSTSFLVPSLDSLLIRDLGLSPACRRIPINQLGCSGGVGALGLAADLVGADPTRNVLVVCVELPSLSLPVVEPSITDVLATTLLGDGASAAVISGRNDANGPEVVATQSLLFPESAEGGGALLTDAGFRMLPAVGLPRLARERLHGTVGDFLARYGLAPRDLAFWVVNPRSPKILDAVGEALELSDADLAPSWSAWERYGSTISATVFFILDELRRSAPPADGSLGLMLSLGAGVTCEMALLRWHDSPAGS